MEWNAINTTIYYFDRKGSGKSALGCFSVWVGNHKVVNAPDNLKKLLGMDISEVIEMYKKTHDKHVIK